MAGGISSTASTATARLNQRRGKERGCCHCRQNDPPHDFLPHERSHAGYRKRVAEQLISTEESSQKL